MAVRHAVIGLQTVHSHTEIIIFSVSIEKSASKTGFPLESEYSNYATLSLAAISAMAELLKKAPPAGSGAEPQPKSNLVHFSLKI